MRNIIFIPHPQVIAMGVVNLWMRNIIVIPDLQECLWIF